MMTRKQSRTRNSVYNIITGFGGQILIVFLNFVCRTVFIKTLGTAYLGINGLFSDILSMLSLAELGFDTAISFRLYKPISQKDNQKVRQYVLFFRNVYKIVGIIIFLLGLCLIPFLRFLIKDYDSLKPLGINASLIFIIYLIQNVSTYLFLAYRSIVVKANQKQYLLSIVGYLISICSSITKMAVLFFLHSFIGYVVTAVVYNIVQNFVNAFVATRAFPEYFEKEKTRLNKAERIDLYKDCGALLVYKINNVVIKATDNLVLSSFVGLTIVGLYSNYLVLYGALYNILHILFRSVKASMGDLFTSDDIEKKYHFFEVMNYIAVILYGTAAVGMAVVGNEVITCWIGNEFVIPQPLPILIGIELLFAGLKLNLAQIRNVSGIFKQMWFRPVLGSIINIVSSIILVQYWGISGVICGTILAAVFANFLVDPNAIHKYSFNKYKPVSYYYKKNIMFILILLLIGAVDYLLCAYVFTGLGLLSLALHILICMISVPGIFIALFWGRPECKYLRLKAKQLLRFGKV